MGKGSRRKDAREKAREASETVRSQMTSSDTLVSVGPIVQAAWHVHPTRKMALERGGKPIPPPTYGTMLIDTGATMSAIDDEVAVELGLEKVGDRESFGIGGHVTRRVVSAVLQIPTPGGGVIHSGEVASIKGMRATWRRNPPLLHGRQVDVIGFIGRDILRLCVFSYDGTTGVYALRFDMRKIQPAHPEFAASLIGDAHAITSGRSPK